MKLDVVQLGDGERMFDFPDGMDLMGDIIDISKKLARMRGRCKRLTEDQRRALATAQQYVRVLDQELLQQLDVIGDDTATDWEKDEAFAAIPLLQLMLGERLAGLKRLRRELLAPEFGW